MASSPESRDSKPYATVTRKNDSVLVSHSEDLSGLTGPVWDMLREAISTMITEKLKVEPPTHEDFVKSIVSQEWNKLQENELSNLTQKFTNDLASSSVYIEIEVEKANKLIEELQSSNEAQKTQIKELQDKLGQQASRLDLLEEFRESHLDSAQPDSSNKRSSCSSHPRYMKETITNLISDYERRKIKFLEDISTRQSQIYHRIIVIEKAIAGKSATTDNLKSLVAENASSMELIVKGLSEVVKINEDLAMRISDLEAASDDQTLCDPSQAQAPLPSSVLQYFGSEQMTPQYTTFSAHYRRFITQRLPSIITFSLNIALSIRKFKLPSLVAVSRNIASSIRKFKLDRRPSQRSVLFVLPSLERVNAQGWAFFRHLGSLSTNLLGPKIHNTGQRMVQVPAWIVLLARIILLAWVVFYSIHRLWMLFVVEVVDVEIMFPSRYRREIVRTGFR